MIAYFHFRGPGGKPEILFDLSDELLKKSTKEQDNDDDKPKPVIPKEHRFAISDISHQHLSVFSHCKGKFLHSMVVGFFEFWIQRIDIFIITLAWIQRTFWGLIHLDALWGFEVNILFKKFLKTAKKINSF